MSRVAKNPVPIPSGVEISLDENIVQFQGLRVSLTLHYQNQYQQSCR